MTATAPTAAPPPQEQPNPPAETTAENDGERVMMTMRFPISLLDRLTRFGNAHFRSRASVIFDACEAYLKQNGG